MSEPAEPEVPAQQRYCLPPPHPFSRFAVPAIIAGLIALAIASWLAMRALGDSSDTVIAIGRETDAPTAALPPSEALIDDERFASALRRWPEREIALTRARAEAMARAAQPERAIAVYDRLASLLPLGLGLGDALGRAESLAALAKWDDALAALAALDLARADEHERARAIALDARCRLARRR
ncbi:MAG: hypothetical protein H0X45_08380 [Planctomycetes bacterium]|nr:hypothetical protein [Planctomycetota bacterium]